MEDSLIERNGLNRDALSPADKCMKWCQNTILAEQSPDCHVVTCAVRTPAMHLELGPFSKGILM